MSGKYWENHFTDKLLKCGFEPLPGRECLFFHRQTFEAESQRLRRRLLVGNESSTKQGWDMITNSGLVLDPPTHLGDYLGCGQFPVHVSPAEAQRRLEHARPLLQDVEGQSEVNT